MTGLRLLAAVALAIATMLSAFARAEDQKEPKLIPVPQSVRGFRDSPEAKAYDTVCEHVRITHRKEFKFTKMETRLLCGDNEGGPIGTPWATIPPNEAAYFMRGFLQDRGYHNPSFIQDGQHLFVDVGARSFLKKYGLEGGPANWHPPRRRMVLGEPLTPARLDDLQNWSLTQIKNDGYACAKVASRADPLTGEALVDLNPEGLRRITGVRTEGDLGLNEKALDRYNAFRLGDIYHENLVTLTKTRIVNDGFLENVVITPKCGEDDVTLVRDLVLGPSHTLSIGVGGSTDLGAVAKTQLRFNRLDKNASSAQVTINASYLQSEQNDQQLKGLINYYYLDSNPRLFIQPSLTFEHEAVSAYEDQTTDAKILHGWSQELANGHLDFELGPSWLATTLSRGTGPTESNAFIAEGDIHWMDHQYEANLANPQTGGTINVTTLATFDSWGANFTAQKLQIQGERLWNILDYDPPLLVLGLRFNVSSVFSPESNVTSNLPLPFLTFLGGDADLRGYDLKSLPTDGTGALSGATASFEIRLHRVIYKLLDPFVFTDTGALGSAGFHLQKPIFMSPGFGLRWGSPVGTLRAYVAERFVTLVDPNGPSYDHALRFGFTFGQEF